jgi:FMN reductase (NADPH)
MIDADVPTTELTAQLARRGSVRAFRNEPIPESWAQAIVEYGMRAPTSSNRQEYTVIRVKDPKLRADLLTICPSQKHIVDAAAFYAICADQNRVARAMSMYGNSYPAFGLEGGLVASIDAALVGITMSYVAESFGLASVLVGALRDNAVAVAEVLRLPPRCYAVFGLSVGWGAVEPIAKPRHDTSAVLHTDAYDAKAHADAIIAYDRDLAAYYRLRGVDTPDAAWSQVMNQRYTAATRPNLRKDLTALGFPME